MRHLAILAMTALSLGLQPESGIHRVPLRRTVGPVSSPKNYAMRERRDPKSGQAVEYDPRPTVAVIDARAGRLRLSWVGHDGRRKEIVYQRPDMVDVVVRAGVTRSSDGAYKYLYRVENLPSSSNPLLAFAVQTFSPRPGFEKRSDLLQTKMAARLMGVGDWYCFFALDSHPTVLPGRSMTFRFSSPDPPGLVECAANGGQAAMKGVGEEPPQELLDVLPTHSAWPRGFTLGPDSRLKNLSSDGQTKLLQDWLPKCESMGWIPKGSGSRYASLMQQSGVESLLARLTIDEAAGGVAAEVVTLVRSLIGR